MKTNIPVIELTNQEARKTTGGYVPPTEEQMKWLREKYGPLADTIIYW